MPPEDLVPKKKYVVASSAIDYISPSEDPDELYRNCWAKYHPEIQPTRPEVKLFQLTQPRISSCKNFFEENVALLEKPEKQLGVARRELSQNEKFFVQQSNSAKKTELARELFFNKKNTPHFFLLP